MDKLQAENSTGKQGVRKQFEKHHYLQSVNLKGVILLNLPGIVAQFELVFAFPNEISFLLAQSKNPKSETNEWNHPKSLQQLLGLMVDVAQSDWDLLKN